MNCFSRSVLSGSFRTIDPSLLDWSEVVPGELVNEELDSYTSVGNEALEHFEVMVSRNTPRSCMFSKPSEIPQSLIVHSLVLAPIF